MPLYHKGLEKKHEPSEVYDAWSHCFVDLSAFVHDYVTGSLKTMEGSLITRCHTLNKKKKVSCEKN